MKATAECPRCVGLGAVVLVIHPELGSSGCDRCAGTGRVPAAEQEDPSEFGLIVAEGFTSGAPDCSTCPAWDGENCGGCYHVAAGSTEGEQ